jgi:hypothetical protein
MKHSRILEAAICQSLLLAMLSCISPAQQRIPVKQDWTGRMTVKATMAGQEGNFMVDLGAGTEVVSKQFAEKLKLAPAGYMTGFRMTGERAEGPRYTGAAIALGPLHSPQDFGVSGHLEKDPIDGLISARIFEHSPVTLDFVQGEIVVETPASFEQRIANGDTVPLKLDDDRDMKLDLFAEFDLGNGQTGLCEIDSGFFGITINKRYMEALGVVPETKGVDKIEFSPGFFTYKTHLPAIALAAAPDQKLENPLVNFGDFIYDCVVGTRFWHDRTLTLDLPSRRLIVARRPVARKG